MLNCSECTLYFRVSILNELTVWIVTFGPLNRCFDCFYSLVGLLVSFLININELLMSICFLVEVSCGTWCTAVVVFYKMKEDFVS